MYTRLSPTMNVISAATVTQYIFRPRPSTERASKVPSVRYTTADSIEWPLGKLDV